MAHSEYPDEQYLDSSQYFNEDNDVFDETTLLAEQQDGHFCHPDPNHQMQMRMHAQSCEEESVHETSRPQPSSPSQATGNEAPIEAPEESALDGAIQYAYQNNLTADFLLRSFSLSHLFSPLVQSTLPVTSEDGFTDSAQLHTLKIPDSTQTDKMEIDNTSLKLIAEARYVLSEDEVQDVTEQVCHPAKIIPDKLELPILRTDNDRDLRIFQKEMLKLTTADALLESIKKHRLPLHPQNLAEGEGMEFSAEARAESQTMMKKAEGERLSMTKASLTYLYGQLQDDYTKDEQMAYMLEEIKYEKASLPPLFKCSYNFSAFI